MSGPPVPISNLPAGQRVKGFTLERQAPKVVTSSSYTVLEADNGRVLVFDSASSQVVTLPADLPEGFECEWVRGNADTATFRLLFQAASGVTMRSSSIWGLNTVYAAATGSRGHITRLAATVVAVTGDLLAQQPFDRPDWRVADIAARDALTVAAADIGQVSRVASPLAFFRLVSVGPATWERVSTTDAGDLTSGTLARARLPALTDADVPATVTAVTGASRTLALSDRGLYLRFTNTSAKTLDVTTATGGSDGEYHVRNAATAGNLTITATGVTINAPSGGTLVLAPRMTATLKRVETNIFDLFGQTTAA